MTKIYCNIVVDENQDEIFLYFQNAFHFFRLQRLIILREGETAATLKEAHSMEKINFHFALYIKHSVLHLLSKMKIL